jgi:hypothetical protein
MSGNHPREFKKRSQLIISAYNEALSVVAMRVNNPHRSPFGINGGNTAPTPTGCAEIVSDDFPELHVDRIVPLLVSTQ